MAATPVLTAEAIIFAINSAIKLSNKIRKAYAQNIQAKSISLPLPGFNPDVEPHTITRFFNEHPEYAESVERLEELHQNASALDLDQKDEPEYREYYLAFSYVEGSGESELGKEEVINMLRVRQWREGRKGQQKVLQLVAGSLIEIGIDYFTQVPGALNQESAQGRILHRFLEAFDEIDFSENADIKKTFSQRLVPSLFAAAAESIAELSPEIASDDKLQRFIKGAARGIADDIYQRAGQLDAHGRREAVHWGQMVLRSMIQNAGSLAFAAPEELLGTNDAVSQIIKSSGVILLDTILSDKSDEVVFRKAISVETLNRMAKATLEVIAEHPEVINSTRGVKEIIGGVAQAVSQEDFRKKGFVPELARIVLEQSAGNLSLLWREAPAGPEHLLVVAVQQILGILSEKHQDAPWRPAFTKRHLLSVVEELLDEVVMNPDWIMDETHGRPMLSEALDLTFRALSTIPSSERLNADVIRWLIRLNTSAVLTNRQVLKKLKWSTEEEEIIILEKGLELVFSFVFPKDAEPDVSRLSLLEELTTFAIEQSLRRQPNRKGLILIDLVLNHSGLDFSQGFDADFANQLMDATLAALASRPELAAKPKALQNILGGIAGALNSNKLRQPGLMPFLIQLLLQQTARNANLILDADQDKPRHLLAVAMEQILNALAAGDGSGRWRPGISTAEATRLIEALIDETVNHPYWLTEKVNEESLLSEVLNTTFDALAAVPAERRLSADTVQLLIQLNLQAVAASPSILQKVDFATDDEEKAILGHALRLLFAFTFPTENTTDGTRLHLFSSLTEYIMGSILRRQPDKKGLILTNLILFQSGMDYSRGFDRTLADELADATLAALASRPELVAHPKALQNILAGIAGTLDSNKLQQPGLMPFLTRLLLEQTARNANLILDADPDKPRHLLATAMEQILNALAAGDGSGQWRPGISTAEAVGLIEILVDETVQNPHWVAQKADQGSLLSEVLDTTFEALAAVPAGQRLSADTLSLLVELNLRAVAASPNILQRITFADDETEKAILSRALNLTLAFVFPADEGNADRRAFLLLDLLDYVLETLLAQNPNKKGLILANLILSEDNGIDYSSGFGQELAGQLADSALAVLNQHPELVSREKALQKIISDTSGALRSSGLDRPELLPELLRLVLESTAVHLYEVFDMDEDDPRHLLVFVTEQVLRAIADKPRSGRWKPRLADEQILDILDALFEAAIEQPQWAEEADLIFEVMEAIFRALEAVPPGRKLPFALVLYLLNTALESAYKQRQFIVKIQTRERGHRQLMLRYSLESIFIVIYDEHDETEESWYLTQEPALRSLIDYYMTLICQSPGKKKDVDHALDKARTAIKTWKKDFTKTLQEAILAIAETP